jgi:2,3-bisphosphoglycerate-independent phosphoglycerate mutase
MIHPKTIIFLGDGMADEPLAELDGMTPLQRANTPGMDSIARDGRAGTLLTLPDEFPTGSEVANMSILGCDLPSEYCGRGPLEAAGAGITLSPEDIAFRLNLVTIEDGILKDYSGGHPSAALADDAVAAMNRSFGNEAIRFCPGVSYRTLLLLSGAGFSTMVATEKPDDHHGDHIDDILPVATEAQAAATVEFLRRLIREAPEVLRELPSDTLSGVWPWSGGRSGSLKQLSQKYGITGAVISAVDVIVGLGKCLGMHHIPVAGATGYVDTNYEGKADAAVSALESHDLVYLHVEAIDEVSHAQDLNLKIKTIEQFDSRIIQRVLAAVDSKVNVAVLPDHPVPVSLGKHTRTAVPVAVRMNGCPPDSVQSYHESACESGELGHMKGDDLMRLLFPH